MEGSREFIKGRIVHNYSIQIWPYISILEGKCNGYTWHEQYDIGNICVLFEQTSIDGSYECSNCISGQMNEIEYCNCHKYPEG